MTEINHYTPEQVEEALREGGAICDRLGLPEPFRSEATLWAAQKLSEKTIMQGAPAILPMQGRIQ